MVIAVNTKYFFKAYQKEYSSFIYQCFKRIIKQQQQHTFIFFSNLDLDPSFDFGANAFSVIVKSGFNSGAFSGIIYKKKIGSLLKKYKADIFINADGFCSLFTKIPQCFIVHHVTCLSNKDFIKKRNSFLYKRFMPQFLNKAKLIVTNSQFSKKFIIRQYKIDEENIDVVYNGISNISSPVNPEERERIKAQYASGNEYFIFNANDSQQEIIMNLLKAFSQFKKWQKSSMQLLIVENNVYNNDIFKSLKSFKYRNEVIIIDNLLKQELEKVFRAAYAILYFPLCDYTVISTLRTMSYNVPLITCNTASIPEICAGAVLYVNPDEPKDISEKLMLIFKDEILRQSLIEKSNVQLQNFNWEETSNLLWQSILKSGRYQLF